VSEFKKGDKIEYYYGCGKRYIKAVVLHVHPSGQLSLRDEDGDSVSVAPRIARKLNPDEVTKL